MKKLNELLGIKYPFIQGGMANIATAQLASAVSNAGGLGLIAAGGMNVDTLRENIRKCREMTDKPFGVNLMLMHPQIDDLAKVVLDEGVKFVTTGAGMPSKYMEDWKKAGIKVFPVTSSVMMAKRLQDLGADMIIAEGCESGGHVGEMTTMAIVPQMVAGLDIPVVAAGGVASGKQLAAAFALGACGVQMGTVFLASDECPIHQNYKDAVLKARDNDTVVTGRIAGSPVRIIKNAMSREYLKHEKQGATIMELEQYTLGSLRRAVFDGDTKTGSLMAGQVSGQIKTIRPVAQIMKDIYDEYLETVHKLAEEAEEIK